jgi:hypothetical protein
MAGGVNIFYTPEKHALINGKIIFSAPANYFLIKRGGPSFGRQDARARGRLKCVKKTAGRWFFLGLIL